MVAPAQYVAPAAVETHQEEKKHDENDGDDSHDGDDSQMVTRDASPQLRTLTAERSEKQEKNNDGDEADKLLESIGLLGHKAELQELAGKTWSVEILAYLEKCDLVETSMSVLEKKIFVAETATSHGM